MQKASSLFSATFYLKQQMWSYCIHHKIQPQQKRIQTSQEQYLLNNRVPQSLLFSLIQEINLYLYHLAQLGHSMIPNQRQENSIVE